jgi:hypothetical protein
VAGRLHAIKAAPILNISEHGALIEAPSVLRPGSTYLLQVGGERAQPITLRAHVVRSYVHKVMAQRGGEGTVRYRAALEFDPMSEETSLALRRHIQSIQGSEEDI